MAGWMRANGRSAAAREDGDAASTCGTACADDRGRDGWSQPNEVLDELSGGGVDAIGGWLGSMRVGAEG